MNTRCIKYTTAADMQTGVPDGADSTAILTARLELAQANIEANRHPSFETSCLAEEAYQRLQRLMQGGLNAR
jgi:hypothetical protein